METWCDRAKSQRESDWTPEGPLEARAEDRNCDTRSQYDLLDPCGWPVKGAFCQTCPANGSWPTLTLSRSAKALSTKAMYIFLLYLASVMDAPPVLLVSDEGGPEASLALAASADLTGAGGFLLLAKKPSSLDAALLLVVWILPLLCFLVGLVGGVEL